MKIKKITLYLAGIFILILISGTFFFSPNLTGNVVYPVSAQTGDVQTVKLSVSGGNYVLSPSTFKKGVPVRLEADISKMPGCSKSIVISAFNVRKTVSSSDNVIEFVPDKAGTFNIACSMNMYRGTFVILDETGEASNYVEPQNAGSGSCSKGGCGGCGR